ncbi:MAG TPA: hypothetical protein IGS40_25010 [Trichormus sp. M33_DOE_039]|nr:hypothetical protein [Trichormus sp. M33_DOE_039]
MKQFLQPYMKDIFPPHPYTPTPLFQLRGTQILHAGKRFLVDWQLVGSLNRQAVSD